MKFASQIRRRHWITGVAAVVVLLLVRCVSAPPARGMVVCGAPFDLGTRVVTWREPGGYDAYVTRKVFTPEDVPDGKLRYSPLRGGLPAAMQERAAKNGLTLADLQQVVHQFVLHFDVCGTSRQCFKILQDVRNLSVHFLLDVDGTIYQTLDLREKAWHATIANDFSVGVEIAHPGAWPQPLNADMRRWYERDDTGWRMKYPEWMQETGIRTPDFTARPDRPEIVSGEVQGRTWFQFDYTTQQYEALARLCAGLARVFPRIRLEVPRNPDGSVVNHVLPEDELRAFDGIVGHFHVQQNKQDPGPAMQWDRLLEQARALRDPAGN
ncbi:MAG TPA: N-acetylmuramoyl-L-alanine amidase [Planctomycetota bacterium]|nr:N-acetylmuramoyl-L-alanine amidase [Planctomycetota bacterium]